MKLNFKKTVSVIVMLFMLIGIVPTVSADEVILHFEDVTENLEYSALQGEAKMLVSVEGLTGTVDNMQLTFGFSGLLKYKTVEYLVEADYLQFPSVSRANYENKIIPVIIDNEGIEFDGEKTPLFVLVFEGDAGDVAYVNMEADAVDASPVGISYYRANGQVVAFSETAELQYEAVASATGVQGTDVTVEITLDELGIAQYTGSGFADTGITLTLTNKATNHVFSTTLNNENMPDGHRDGEYSGTAFKVTTTVKDGDTFDIALNGLGYTSYETEETFNFQNNKIYITDFEFVPGDCDGDGDVDTNDTTAFENAVANGVSAQSKNAYDFNRDGNINNTDKAVLPALPTTDGEQGGTTTPPGGDNQGGTTPPPAGGGGGGGGGGDWKAPTEDSETEDKTENNEASKKSFSDLANYGWAEDAIYELKEKGFINGTSETAYSPANNIKRGDYILILSRILNLNGEFSENFTDVPSDSYYYNAIGSAKSAGIATGDGISFMPENPITRQDLITLTYRAFLNAGYIEEINDTSMLDSFNDKGNISEYAMNAMTSMVNAGIIQGSDGNVNPLGFATRAEVAVMCSRLLKLIK